MRKSTDCCFRTMSPHGVVLPRRWSPVKCSCWPLLVSSDSNFSSWPIRSTPSDDAVSPPPSFCFTRGLLEFVFFEGAIVLRREGGGLPLQYGETAKRGGICQNETTRCWWIVEYVTVISSSSRNMLWGNAL